MGRDKDYDTPDRAFEREDTGERRAGDDLSSYARELLRVLGDVPPDVPWQQVSVERAATCFARIARAPERHENAVHQLAGLLRARIVELRACADRVEADAATGRVRAADASAVLANLAVTLAEVQPDGASADAVWQRAVRLRGEREEPGEPTVASDWAWAARRFGAGGRCPETAHVRAAGARGPIDDVLRAHVDACATCLQSYARARLVSSRPRSPETVVFELAAGEEQSVRGPVGSAARLGLHDGELILRLGAGWTVTRGHDWYEDQPLAVAARGDRTWSLGAIRVLEGNPIEILIEGGNVSEPLCFVVIES